MSGTQTLVMGEYMWIVVIGAFSAFLFGYGTGSNDVANAFGTSVGSKCLTLKQAVVIAIIFEFTGALVLGRVAQETISVGIADISAFNHDPEFFALGMMWALLVGGVWQILASTYELNVSATHSIIGAVVGFSMAFKGAGAVMWAQEQIQCTGPLIFLSPCDGITCPKTPEALMYKPSVTVGVNPNGQYLVGTYTVDVGDVYNKTTGALNGNKTVTVPWLSARMGVNISLVSESVNSAGVITNFAQPQPVANPFTATFYVTLPGYGDPLQQNATDRKVFFTLKTATPKGDNWDCGGLNCPIIPAKTSPVKPYQMMYESRAPFCTTHSNANAPFPPYRGVLIIVLSWFFSPVLTGIASCILFNLVRFLVLRRENAYKRSFFVLPFLAFLTFWVNTFFVLTRGAAKLLSKDAEGWTTTKAAWICAAVAGGISLFSIVVVAPLLYHRVNTTFLKKQEEAAAEDAAREEAAQNAKDLEEKGEPFPEAEGEPVVAARTGVMKFLGVMKKARDAAMHGVEADVFTKYVEDDPLVAAIHKNAEVFDEKAEMVFSYMQVFSAICVIFSHGAGEVGYMSGPLGAIWQVVRSGHLLSNSSPPIWTVLIGALGLVIGLATYGYQLTGAMGSKLAKLTPSRGFAAELATSLVIMVAAQYGLPTSSSQCITGGILGVALCEGRAGLNLKYFLETFCSWIITMIMMASLTAFMFAQGAFAPSVQMSRIIGYYEEAISIRSELLFRGYQNILARSGYLTTNTGNTGDVFAAFLSQTITNVGPGGYYNKARNPMGFFPGAPAPSVQTPPPWQMIGYLDAALALMGSVIAPNPYGLMMCSTTGSTTAYEQDKSKFPWYKSLAATTPSRGPCTGTNSLLSPLPPNAFLTVPAPPTFSDSTVCIQEGAELPPCTGAAGEQDYTTVFSGLTSARGQFVTAYQSAAAAVNATASKFGESYILGNNVSITLVVPALPTVLEPIVGSVMCVPPGASQPPLCASGATGQTDAATAAAAVASAFQASVSAANASFIALASNAASFSRAVNNIPAGTYRSSVISAVNRTFTPGFTPMLTLATFVGPNPKCPPVGNFLYSCPESRYVDASGKPVKFVEYVPSLFSNGRPATQVLSMTTLMTTPLPLQGHVTLDQIRLGNPNTPITVFGTPETTAGTSVCLHPPCNVAYLDRPWYTGR